MIIFASIPCPDCAGKFAQKSSSKLAKSTQIELEFLKKCLKFRNSARKLLVVINYFLADVHKYSSFIKALTIDFPIGDQTTSEKPMFFFSKSTVPTVKRIIMHFHDNIQGTRWNYSNSR